MINSVDFPTQGDSPRQVASLSNEPYQEQFDLADPYASIVSCYLSQSRNAGGVYLSKVGMVGAPSRPSKNRPKFHGSTGGKVYGNTYYLRAGTGHKGTPYCGQVQAVGACEDKTCHASLPRLIKASCHRYDCPECYHDAIERMAKESSDRINSFEVDFYEEVGERPGKRKQFVFSPNPRLWTRQRVLSDNGAALDRELKRLCDYAFKDGFYALEVLTHLEREKHQDGTECTEEDCHKEHIWQWGPHFHGLGYGFIKTIAEIHAKFPGWNIKVVPEGKTKDGKPRERDSYATLLYLGSHASIFYNATTRRQSRKVIKHLGISNPRTYRRTLDHVEYERLKCTCGRDLKAFVPTEDYQPNRALDMGPMMEKKAVYRYSFKQAALTKFLRRREEQRAFKASPEGLRKRARELRDLFASTVCEDDQPLQQQLIRRNDHEPQIESEQGNTIRRTEPGTSR